MQMPKSRVFLFPVIVATLMLGIAVGFERWYTGSSLAQKAGKVDLALVLAIDCSFSVNATEFDLQMRGLSAALASEEVVDAIISGPYGAIVIMVVEWAGVRDQKIVVPWTILDSAQSVRRIADTIAVAPRLASGKTSISAIIDFSILQLSAAPVTATRQIIDVSADGVNNTGALPKAARERAVAAGITINGLAIINEVEALDAYFEKYIIGGPGHFVLVANDYQSFESAMKQKLLKEILGTPLS